MTARIRCGWVKFMECGEFVYCGKVSLKLKAAVYKSYVRPVILYGSEACHLKEG